METTRSNSSVFVVPLLAIGLAACTSPGQTPELSPPQLTPAVASVMPNNACAEVISKFQWANTQVTAAVQIATAGMIMTSIAAPIPEHCQVTGKMNARVSPVDNKAYAIGFEMRLPKNWNGRFFYQANGGIDGSVVTATGNLLGGAPVSTALHQGFAVISSDAGHPANYGPFFGLDPQARIDYGYSAVAVLTPMAKSLIQSVYGRPPDRSYLVGCSNGGRHALVAASRLTNEYDGILAGNPGFNLPQAAVAQLYGAQQYASIATKDAKDQLDISTAVTPTEWALLGASITAKCDALDGVKDGIVSNTSACQAAFKIDQDVPTCSGARDGTCLNTAQKKVLGNIFSGAKNSKGEALYSDFPYDPGVAGSNYRFWEFTAAQNLDPGAVAFIFTTPPSTMAAFTSSTGLNYALTFNMDTDAPKIFATSATYPQASMTFMTPVANDLTALRTRGAKLMVFHGVADAVFSSSDTQHWFNRLNQSHQGKADRFARYFPIPGMNHCSAGPSTDQFDMVKPLVQWVEQGIAPDNIVATARGKGANAINAELPANWAPNRTRPICAYPKFADYKGYGDIELAGSFVCR